MMNQVKKRLPSGASLQKSLPAGAALLMALGATTFVAMPTAMADAGTAPKVSLQEAEHIAVAAFSIPGNYTLQNESYNDNEEGTQPPSYSLNYQEKDASANGQWVNVTINAITGDILNYNRPSADNQFVFPVPVSADKAKQIADGWAKKLFPNQWSHVQSLPLTPTSGALAGPTQYTFTYERMVNGLPAPFDGFTFIINQNGDLVSVQDNWTALAFPSAKPSVSKTIAGAAYGKSLKLYLEYQSIWNGDNQPSLELAYDIAPQNYPGWWGQLFTNLNVIEYPVIDASTGKVIDSNGQVYTPKAYPSLKPLVPGGSVWGVSPKKVNWTEQQSLAEAQKLLHITASDKLQNASQTQGGTNDAIWNFSWRTHNQMNVNVSVDATYGYISNYDNYPAAPPGKPNAKPKKLTQAQLNAVVNNFVKQVLPGNTGSIAVVPSPEGQPDSSSLQTSFQLISLVNGIPDPSQSGSVNVDPQTGQVQNLWMNTQGIGIAHPAVASAVSPTVAAEHWMNARPLKLEYLLTQPQMTEKMSPMTGKTPTALAKPEIVLAYAPVADQTSSGTFNAVTGKFESPNAAVPFTGKIQDLNSVTGAAQIQLLADRELVTVDANGNVHPNQTMTHSAFLKLLVDALGYQGRINPILMKSAAASTAMSAVLPGSPDYNEIGAAYSMGWIPENEKFDPSAVTTRDYAAQVLTRAVDMAALMSHPEAFHFTPSDAASISQQSLAGDAIAATLGLIPLQNGLFNANGQMTLSDTAIAVVQAASVLGLQGHPYRTLAAN